MIIWMAGASSLKQLCLHIEWGEHRTPSYPQQHSEVKMPQEFSSCVTLIRKTNFFLILLTLLTAQLRLHAAHFCSCFHDKKSSCKCLLFRPKWQTPIVYTPRLCTEPTLKTGVQIINEAEFECTYTLNFVDSHTVSASNSHRYTLPQCEHHYWSFSQESIGCLHTI